MWGPTWTASSPLVLPQPEGLATILDSIGQLLGVSRAWGGGVSVWQRILWLTLGGYLPRGLGSALQQLPCCCALRAWFPSAGLGSWGCAGSAWPWD